MDDNTKPNIIFAPTDKVSQYEREVQIILSQLGHPEALVTDESTFAHFIMEDDAVSDDAELDRVMDPIGLAGLVNINTTIAEAAILLRVVIDALHSGPWGDERILDPAPPTRWQRVKAYLNGMREFRLDMTTNYGGDLIESYDAGRERMHRLTLRHWDEP